MDFRLILYIVVSIMLITGSFYLNFSNGRATQGIILAVGFLLLSVLFGFRWFTGSTSNPTGSWPPSINVCPDYLTLTKVNGVATCVDPIGVSQQGMEVWTSPDQTDPKYLFDLAMSQTGAARTSSLCKECSAKMVTWEGVWDGSVCLNGIPPVPT
jgi:hypothetical protein